MVTNKEGLQDCLESARLKKYKYLMDSKSKIEDHSSELGSFSCPSFRLIQQLFAEVKALRLEIRDRFELYPEVIDNSDLFKIYKISRTTAQTWRNKGLGYIKMGGKLYYNRKEVELFLVKHNKRGF